MAVSMPVLYSFISQPLASLPGSKMQWTEQKALVTLFHQFWNSTRATLFVSNQHDLLQCSQLIKAKKLLNSLLLLQS